VIGVIAGILLRRLAVPDFISQLSDAVMTAVFTVYVSFCLMGAVQAWRGRVLRYPFVSGRMYRRYAAAARRKD